MARMSKFLNGLTPYCWITCLLFVTTSFHKPGVAMGNDEISALIMLRRNLTDPNGALQSWDENFIDPCTFFHITCNAEHSVIQIDLIGQGLSGSLVPELGYLQNLQHLKIQKNNISGPIPPELGALENLIVLDIFENSFSGSIPESFGNLSSLIIFRANNNSLSGKIPISLTNLKNLQTLELGFNKLIGEVPNNGSFALFTVASFEGNGGLCGPTIGVPCPTAAPFAHPPLLGPSINNSSGSSSFTRSWAMLVATLAFVFATITTHQWTDMLAQKPHPCS